MGKGESGRARKRVPTPRSKVKQEASITNPAGLPQKLWDELWEQARLISQKLNESFKEIIVDENVSKGTESYDARIAYLAACQLLAAHGYTFAKSAAVENPQQLLELGQTLTDTATSVLMSALTQAVNERLQTFVPGNSPGEETKTEG